MKNLKVIKIDQYGLKFNNGVQLYSEHDQDCCESHCLSLSDLSLNDFNGLEFDLTNDDFFKRIPGYGIELVPVKGWSIRVPGYASNNGYYSSNLRLVLTDNKEFLKIFDIKECQDY